MLITILLLYVSRQTHHKIWKKHQKKCCENEIKFVYVIDYKLFIYIFCGDKFVECF